MIQNRTAKKLTVYTEYKALCLGQIQHNISLSSTLHIFKHGVGCIMLWVCLSLAKSWRTSWFNLISNGHWETNSPFSKDNNLKHKAKYTLEFTEGWWHLHLGEWARGNDWSRISGMVSNIWRTGSPVYICSVPAIIVSRFPLRSIRCGSCWPRKHWMFLSTVLT